MQIQLVAFACFVSSPVAACFPCEVEVVRQADQKFIRERAEKHFVNGSEFQPEDNAKRCRCPEMVLGPGRSPRFATAPGKPRFLQAKLWGRCQKSLSHSKNQDGQLRKSFHKELGHKSEIRDPNLSGKTVSFCQKLISSCGGTAYSSKGQFRSQLQAFLVWRLQ